MIGVRDDQKHPLHHVRPAAVGLPVLLWPSTSFDAEYRRTSGAWRALYPRLCVVADLRRLAHEHLYGPLRAIPWRSVERTGFRLAAITVASACAFAWGTPADAQLLNHKDLTASIAFTIAETAIATCKANGYKVSVTVVDRDGQIILQVRGDDANPHTMENSMRKAYTARTTRNPSGALADRLKADPTLSLIHLTNIIAARGALPIKVGDDVI